MVALSIFAKQLGIVNAAQLLLESPFDYVNQSQLFIPRYLPAANHPDRPKALVELAVPLIKASQGACFLLFTSYRMMNMVAELLAGQIENPLLLQGTMGKRKVIRRIC